MTWRRRTAGRKTFRIDELVRGSRHVGIEIGAQTPLHFAELDHTDFTLGELHTKYDYQIEGVAPLRAITRVDLAREEPRDDAVLVELLPQGTTLLETPVPVERRASVALALARIVQRSTAQRVALLGLLPELIFVGAATSVMPRSWTFLGLKSRRWKTLDGEPSFDRERSGAFIDPTNLMLPDPRSDTYLLGLAITWIWTNRHAFAQAAKLEHGGDTIEAMRWSARDAWPGPPAIDEILAAILVPGVERRPSIDDVVTALVRCVPD